MHYDSDHKLLAKLQNIYMTRFDAGFIFDEIAGKEKELFKILNVPVPTAESVIADEPADIDPEELREMQETAELVCGDDMEDL